MDNTTRSAAGRSNQPGKFGASLGSNTFPDFFQVGGGQISATSQYDALRRLPDQLRNWYDTDDEPWNPYAGPAAGVDSRAQGLPPSFTHYQSRPVPSVLSECETVPQSFLQSDSGYASGPRPSVGNPSIYGDADHGCETQSISYQLSDFQLEHSRMEGQNSNEQHDIRPDLGVIADELQQENPSGSRPTRVCRVCKQEVKTNSELKKHEHKHKKPFQCDVPGCSRQNEGFTSNSDLTRHKKTVHRGMQGAPVPEYYRCPGGCRSRNQGKVMTRADNFRAHMRKCHSITLTSDDDLSHYRVQDPARTSVPALTPALAGMGYAAANDLRVPSDSARQTLGASWAVEKPMSDISEEQAGEQIHGQQSQRPVVTRSFASSLDSAFTVQSGERTATSTSQFAVGILHELSERHSPKTDYDIAEVFAALNQSDASRAKVGWQEGPLALQNAMSSSSQSGLDSGYCGLASEGLRPATLPKPKPSTNTNEIFMFGTKGPYKPTKDSDDGKVLKGEAEAAETDSDSSGPGELVIDLENDDSITSALHTLAERKGDGLKKMLEKMGYQKIGDSTKGDRKDHSATAASTNNKCHRCSKAFQQPYQLNKHMLRHERPYGCTFSRCPKLFGSKNDWKRHESTQHSQLEMWRCGEPNKSCTDARCEQVFHRRTAMEKHLRLHHCIQSAALLEARMTDYRAGRGCARRFWCGFCETMITTNQKGLHAWGARIDHIADHFTGRGGLPKRSVWEWKQIDPVLDLTLAQESDMDSAEGDGLAAAAELDSEHSPSGNKRRVGSDSDEERGQKRRRVVGTWVCCRCQTTCEDAFSCEGASCDHEFCDNCIGERRALV